MTDEQRVLWNRISTFPIDAPGACAPYSTRLRKENRWTPEFTFRVIEEYRRFAFLSVVSGHMVSPSETVDQAWHLHLFYTQSYWGEFCRNTLGRQLHHNPSQGGRRETSVFDNAYAQTLASYERFFGEPAPVDIWPSPSQRAAERHDFVRVDRTQHWIVPKLRWRSVAPYAAVGAFLFVLAGCEEAPGSLNPFDLNGPHFLNFFMGLMAVCIGAAALVRHFGRLPGPSDLQNMQEITPLEAACLGGDLAHGVTAAVSALVMCGYVKIHPVLKSIEASDPEPNLQGLDPLAAHIVSECAVPGGCQLSKLIASTSLSMLAIRERLVQRELMLSGPNRLKVGLLAACLAWAPLAVGIPRIIHGVSVDHPVGYLVLLCILTGIIGLAFAVAAPRRTLRGDAVLSRQRQQRSNLRSIDPQQVVSLPEALMAVSLFGIAAMPGDMSHDMRMLIAPSNSGSSGGCSSSGCGSGGCSGGGGCGGGCGG